MGGVTGRIGPNWERIGIDHARLDYELPWERAPLKGNRDTLDTQGSLGAGFLVGFKGITRKHGQSFGDKISEAMAQCDRALINIGRPYIVDGNGRMLIDCGGIIPVQVMQRSGYPVGKAYVVTQYDYFLDLARERAKERAER